MHRNKYNREFSTGCQIAYSKEILRPIGLYSLLMWVCCEGFEDHCIIVINNIICNTDFFRLYVFNITCKIVHDNEQKVLFLAKLFVVGTCTYNLYVQGTYNCVPVYKLSIFSSVV